MTIRKSTGLLALLLWFATAATAGESAIRSYPLPGHGEIRLDVPPSWQEELTQPRELPPTITFHEGAGQPFRVMVTPMWSADGREITDTMLRRNVLSAVKHASQQSVEEAINVREIKGNSGLGYYFSATDKAPKPGEFRIMTQGMIRIGTLATAFTILTNDGQRQVILDALQMLSTATHRP